MAAQLPTPPMTAGNSQAAERLRLAREYFGMTQPELADKCGVSIRALQDYEAGKRLPGAEVLSALAKMGIDLNWLLTGVGQMCHAAPGAQADVDAAFHAQMQSIQTALQNEECPIPEEQLRDRPDLAEIRQQLSRLAHDAAISEDRRATADLALKLAFGDQVAAAQSEERLGNIGRQLREARTLIEEAAMAVGWTPPPATSQALHTLAFRYRITAEDLVLLLDAMRVELSPPRTE